MDRTLKTPYVPFVDMDDENDEEPPRDTIIQVMPDQDKCMFWTIWICWWFLSVCYYKMIWWVDCFIIYLKLYIILLDFLAAVVRKTTAAKKSVSLVRKKSVCLVSCQSVVWSWKSFSCYTMSKRKNPMGSENVFATSGKKFISVGL